MAETEKLRGMPIIVLGEDENEEKIQRAYDLHANAYVKKPTQRDDLRDTAETITDFWIRTNELPSTIDEDRGSSPADS